MSEFARSGTSRMIDGNSVYNFKRRMASLPPMSITTFQEQVLASDSGNDEKDESSLFQRSCNACEHHYTNPKAWQTHLTSRNHVQKTAKIDSEASFLPDGSPPSTLPLNGHEEDLLANKEESFSPFRCLFCNVESASIDSNLTHMSHAHSFFIPDAEYLIDMESFLSYLFAVVSVFHECLSCGSSKTTKFGVQAHMRGKGHCNIIFEDDEHDFERFYDFSGDMDDRRNQPKPKPTLVPNEDELHLPSGKIVGHRSRARLRQDLSDHPSSSSSFRQQPRTDTVSMESTDRSLAMRAGTSTSLVGVPALERRALIAIEKKMKKMETREKTKYQHVVEKGGNQQKRYKVAGIGKKQGGLEKRLG